MGLGGGAAWGCIGAQHGTALGHIIGPRTGAVRDCAGAQHGTAQGCTVKLRRGTPTHMHPPPHTHTPTHPHTPPHPHPHPHTPTPPHTPTHPHPPPHIIRTLCNAEHTRHMLHIWGSMGLQCVCGGGGGGCRSKTGCQAPYLLLVSLMVHEQICRRAFPDPQLLPPAPNGHCVTSRPRPPGTPFLSG